MELQEEESKRNGENIQFLVKASFLEIFQEQIIDLLDDSHSM